MLINNVIYNLAVFFAVMSSSCSLPSQPPTEYEGWELVWSDEFNHNGPVDSSSWSFEHGFVRNSELQWYQDKNAYCKDGLLVIEGRKEKVKNPNYKPDSKSWKENR